MVYESSLQVGSSESTSPEMKAGIAVFRVPVSGGDQAG
jgi:hypothetical protein